MAPFVSPYPVVDARRISAEDSTSPSAFNITASRSNSFDDGSLSCYSCAATVSFDQPKSVMTKHPDYCNTVVSPQYSLQYPLSYEQNPHLHHQTTQKTTPNASASQQPLSASAKLDSYKKRYSHRMTSTQVIPVIDNTTTLLTDAIHPNKYKMKQQRRGMTAMGAVGGAVVGTMVFPVIGTAVGGAAAGYACNKLSKQGERRAQRKWEQTSFQRQASQSPVVNAVYV